MANESVRSRPPDSEVTAGTQPQAQAAADIPTQSEPDVLPAARTLAPVQQPEDRDCQPE
jgi:hypothetical protein